MASPAEPLRRPMARTRRYERRDQGSNPCGGSTALPSSRPGDDTSLLRRTSSVRGRGRQPTHATQYGRFDFWRGPRPFTPKRRVRSPYRLPAHAGLARLTERLTSNQEAAESWPAPCSRQCPRGVQQQHVGLQNRRSRRKAVRGYQFTCFASVDSDARPS